MLPNCHFERSKAERRNLHLILAGISPRGHFVPLVEMTALPHPRVILRRSRRVPRMKVRTSLIGMFRYAQHDAALFPPTTACGGASPPKGEAFFSAPL